MWLCEISQVPFSTNEGHIFYEFIGQYVVYDKVDAEARTPEAESAKTAAPDCTFDEAFGYPCSEKQLACVAKAAKEVRF